MEWMSENDSHMGTGGWGSFSFLYTLIHYHKFLFPLSLFLGSDIVCTVEWVAFFLASRSWVTSARVMGHDVS